jgi:hypothetical protein
MGLHTHHHQVMLMEKLASLGVAEKWIAYYLHTPPTITSSENSGQWPLYRFLDFYHNPGINLL